MVGRNYVDAEFLGGGNVEDSVDVKVCSKRGIAV